MKGRTFKAAVLAVFGLAIFCLWMAYYRPQQILRSLDEQVQHLAQQSKNYEKRSDKLTALKLEQIAYIIKPGNDPNNEQFLRLVERAERMDANSTYADHSRAEDFVAEELRALGEPLITQLGLVLENGPQARGFACIGLRVLSKISRQRVTKIVSKIVCEGKNDLLAREAVIQCLLLNEQKMTKELINLVWKWKGWGRQYPIYVLRRFEAKSALPALIAALQDSSPAVRRHAVMSLIELGDGRALAPLRELIKSEKDKIALTLAEKAIDTIRRKIPPIERPSVKDSTSGRKIPIQE